MWVLRFDNNVTSAGFAVTDDLAAELRHGEGDPADVWQRFLARYPSIRAQFADARPVQPFHRASRLSYRSRVAAGPGWLLLPSAAAFVDPLFSTGIPLTLLGIERIGRALERFGAEVPPSVLDDLGRTTLAEADWVAAFVAGCCLLYTSPSPRD